MGTPGSQSTKTREQTQYFPKTFNIQQYFINMQPPNDFLLFPQAVPSRTPTSLYGPLPPQTFGLILGQSRMNSKITIHPEILIQIMRKKFNL